MSNRIETTTQQRGVLARPGARWPSWSASLCVALASAWMFLDPPRIRGQSTSSSVVEINREYPIKAAYLYNFGRYVTWPEDAFAPTGGMFVIGVLGPDPFGDLLDQIAATKKLDGRPIAVRRFASMDEYEPCHVLYVSKDVAPEESTRAIQRAKDDPVLLVGEVPDFAHRGGAIRFYIQRNNIRFEISAEASRREQLKISSKLLRLGRIVGTR